MEKEIKIGEQTVRFRVSALIPRLYRHKFGRDLIVDMGKLSEQAKSAEGLAAEGFEIFEDLAYIMAKHADASAPNSAEEWLASLPDLVAFYQSLPEIMELWAENLSTTSTAKKK